MKKTLGGDRLGSGSKQQVELHGYERSTHDLGYLWRSTMASGTLVPFMSEVALPGDTFDIDLNCDVKTHPTTGPLFGSYKVQLDVFQAPMRLYHALLHNNKLGIGLNMAQVALPQITFTAQPNNPDLKDLDNAQVNPSSLPAYLGMRGVGRNTSASAQTRNFNAIPLLAYWEIYKCYYANKQEEIGAVLHTPSEDLGTVPDNIEIVTAGTLDPQGSVPLYPSTGGIPMDGTMQINLEYTGTAPNPTNVMIHSDIYGWQSANFYITGTWTDGGTLLRALYNPSLSGAVFDTWRMREGTDLNTGKPSVVTFPLDNIDQMREAILTYHTVGAPFIINDEAPLEPYKWIYEQPNDTPNILSSQEGLALKTYQSDLFNNWLQTEWIDGTTGINAITAVDTSGGSFTIDTLNLSKKVYDMLNRIAVSGGTYDDWLDAVWAHDRYTRAETPIYCGGLSKELVFQEVVSNAQTEDQALGTLAGRGTMSSKHKGGKIVIKVDEPSYIIGIISLTPRIDYSQGNKWDIHLQTMDDLHKPALDEIGFQELITEQMAWWDTTHGATGPWVTKSAGKQPAWINYMTNVNQVRGNFAIKDNEMFMTLNRRYEMKEDGSGIKDLTTYIDPSKYNFIFAETQLDAQNFWTQIAVNIEARRKMSAKVMPNL